MFFVRNVNEHAKNTYSSCFVLMIIRLITESTVPTSTNKTSKDKKVCFVKLLQMVGLLVAVFQWQTVSMILYYRSDFK